MHLSAGAVAAPWVERVSPQLLMTLVVDTLSIVVPITSTWKLTYVTGKCPVPFNRLPNKFDSSVVCEVLRVTTYHVKLLHSKSVGPLSSRARLWSFWCASGATISGRNVSQTCMQPHSQRPLLAIWNSRTASDERYGSLATRLRVSLLSSMIQLSPPPGWPRQSTDEAQAKQRWRSIWFPSAYFASRVGACKGIVTPLKHLLRATTHP